jgi:hypothetical protein
MMIFVHILHLISSFSSGATKVIQLLIISYSSTPIMIKNYQIITTFGYKINSHVGASQLNVDMVQNVKS